MIEAQNPLIFLILAKDEAQVLRGSLRAIHEQMDAVDQIHVVADHCSDDTAAIARRGGAIVHVRSDRGPRGKAAALTWWVQHQNLDPQQVVVLLDADSEILPGFATQMRRAMCPGVQAVQAKLVAGTPGDSLIGRLIAISERMDQGFFDRIRSHMGGSVRLRGTGMALRYGALTRFTPALKTKTEDIELTLLMAAHGIKVLPAFSATLRDPKPDIPLGAMNQRARWLQGQTEIIRNYPHLILKLMLGSYLDFGLMTACFLKPRSLFSLFRLILNIVILLATVASSASPWLVAGMVLATILVNMPELMALGYSLWNSPNRRADVFALAALPAFFLLWLGSVLLSSESRSPWLRARPVQAPPGINETAPAAR